ncbi:DUF397 domain-containing protein [Streptomyces cellostaticus]|uniref:DUF397 domain-containing protein n=1 Tax=Streptomyces cellostaticus TaxID=67285 RepID=UPI00202699D0|nr:DUF397 domain-containing protein [Streptomyces cellostaticus]
MTTLDNWLKSSHSGGGDGNNCVEIAARPARIAIRDSKDPSAGILVFPPEAFVSFVAALRDGQGHPEPS